MRKRIVLVGLAAIAMLAPSPAAAQDTLTGKERSSRKWLDEQRVDNCRVPPELRGSVPRPGCRDEGTTANRTPATR